MIVSRQDINGMAELIHLLPCVTYAGYIASLLGFLIRSVVYPYCICPVQPGRAVLLGSPHSHKQIKDNSLANFEAFSSSLVPPKSENPIEQGQNQVDDQGLPSEGLLFPEMSAEGFLADAGVKLISVEGQHFSLAGSEEDGGDRSMSIIHVVSRSKMVRQNQVDNFQAEDRNHLLMIKFEWLRYLDPIGFNIPALKAVNIVNRGKSSSIDQTVIKNINKTTLSQTAPCVLQTQQGNVSGSPVQTGFLKKFILWIQHHRCKRHRVISVAIMVKRNSTLKSLKNSVIISLMLGLRRKSQ